MNIYKNPDSGIIISNKGMPDWLIMFKGWGLRLLLKSLNLDMHKNSKILMSEEWL